MKRTEPQGRPQGVVALGQADTEGHSNQVVDAEAPGKTPQPPTHPAIIFWDINRKLEKLAKAYRQDQEKKLTEFEFSSIGNPRCAAISWRVTRLEQYVEEIKAGYEKEIESGRLADTPDLWAAVFGPSRNAPLLVVVARNVQVIRRPQWIWEKSRNAASPARL